MIYEMIVYRDHPGRVQAHVDRFRNHTGKLLEKQGFKLIGCWTSATDEASNELVWMIAHESVEAWEKAHAAFIADPERIAMVEESEKDGPIIDRSELRVLKPTNFSFLQ